ncbi:MAG: hypothetical protein KME22_00685 [Hassallia sp. WJT32-NPBG1]|jgi:hypothetical protein|nr:hypothetical protein [Hassallia sp. WJT32-NPBG1]
MSRVKSQYRAFDTANQGTSAIALINPRDPQAREEYCQGIVSFEPIRAININ